MIKYNGRDDRLDAFLESVIEPAAAEYAESMIAAAQNPQYSMPPELDKRCLERINGSSTAVRRSLRTILIAAVIAALLGTSAFAVYNEVRQSLAMKREDVDEGSRITFVSTTQDTQPASYQTAADLVLGYIPEGFELIYDIAETDKYVDNYGNRFIVERIQIGRNSAIILNTENEEVIPIVCGEYEGYMSMADVDGQTRRSYVVFDTENQITYNLMTFGLSEKEAEKILEEISCEKQD